MLCMAPSWPEMSTPAQKRRSPATAIATGVPFELMGVLVVPPIVVARIAWSVSAVQNTLVPAVARLTISTLLLTTVSGVFVANGKRLIVVVSATYTCVALLVNALGRVNVAS